MNTKLCVRDAEFTERAEELRRDAERLRRVRARVRNIIATDEALRRALDDSALWDPDQEINVHTTPEQGLSRLHLNNTQRLSPVVWPVVLVQR